MPPQQIFGISLPTVPMGEIGPPYSYNVGIRARPDRATASFLGISTAGEVPVPGVFVSEYTETPPIRGWEHIRTHKANGSGIYKSPHYTLGTYTALTFWHGDVDFHKGVKEWGPGTSPTGRTHRILGYDVLGPYSGIYRHEVYGTFSSSCVGGKLNPPSIPTLSASDLVKIATEPPKVTLPTGGYVKMNGLLGKLLPRGINLGYLSSMPLNVLVNGKSVARGFPGGSINVTTILPELSSIGAQLSKYVPSSPQIPLPPSSTKLVAELKSAIGAEPVELLGKSVKVTVQALDCPACKSTGTLYIPSTSTLFSQLKAVVPVVAVPACIRDFTLSLPTQITKITKIFNINVSGAGEYTGPLDVILDGRTIGTMSISKGSGKMPLANLVDMSKVTLGSHTLQTRLYNSTECVAEGFPPSKTKSKTFSLIEYPESWKPEELLIPKVPTKKFIKLYVQPKARVGEAVKIISGGFCTIAGKEADLHDEKATLYVNNVAQPFGTIRHGIVTFNWIPEEVGTYTLYVAVPESVACPISGESKKATVIILEKPEIDVEELKKYWEERRREEAKLREEFKEIGRIKEVETMPSSDIVEFESYLWNVPELIDMVEVVKGEKEETALKKIADEIANLSPERREDPNVKKIVEKLIEMGIPVLGG